MQEWSLDSEECQVFLEKTGGDLHWPDCKGGLNTHECAPSHAVIIWNCWAGVKAQRSAPHRERTETYKEYNYSFLKST